MQAAISTHMPPPAQPLSGVICDMDGTLVDSEFLAPLAWASVLREVGVSLPEGAAGVDEVAATISTPAMRGAAALAIAVHLSATYGVDAAAHPPAWMAARKRATAVEQAAGGDVDFASLWYAGVPEALIRLTGSMGGTDAVGVCTSNLRPIVEATMQAVGLQNTFGGGKTMQEDVLDATGSPQLKPLPAPYERALRLLGRAPSRVAALEDSVVGVRAAVAAGVGVVLGVLNGEDDGVEAAAALREAGAAGVFPSTVAALDWCTANAVPQPPAQPADMAACAAKEAVVRRYFDGVNAQDYSMIQSCFAPTVTLRDMCGISKGEPRTARPEDMAARCKDFLTAHPDARVWYESPPMADREGSWVWAHWAETGTWKGESCGLAPENTPLDVSGHTRFQLEEINGELKIVRQVVYRTFSDWELLLQSKQSK